MLGLNGDINTDKSYTRINNTDEADEYKQELYKNMR